MKLSEKLQFLRYSHDYSRAYVAYKLGINSEDYACLEEGENSLSLSQIEAITELYAIEPTALFGQSNLQDPPNDSWQDLLGEAVYPLLPDVNNCEASIAYLKTELHDIKSMLHSLLEKLDAR